MAFNPRIAQLLIVVALMSAAVFAFDAARNALWANLGLGLLICAILFIFFWGDTPSPKPTPHLAPNSSTTSQPSLQVMLDQMPIPVVRYSKGETPIAMNRAARTLFQTEDVIHSARNELISAMTTPSSGSKPVLNVLGRRFALSVSEIMSENGDFFLATLTDVQAEINKAEAAALNDTLHILSHEIMNSLTPVASLADIAESYLEGETGPAAQSAREALEMLSRRATSLTRFIEAYRSVARLPQPVTKSTDPERLIKEVMDPFLHGSMATDVDFDISLGEHLPRLSLDGPQIAQAIINVVTNAIEATEGQDAPRRVSVALRQTQRNIVIEISDNGEGIAESVRPNLFNGFTTTKAKGTGTGLNLARQIALAHGGDLELKDDRADGLTTFAFTFPIQV